MVRNEGNLDRILRALVGALLLVAWIAGWTTGALALVLGVVGAEHPAHPAVAEDPEHPVGPEVLPLGRAGHRWPRGRVAI